MNIQIPTLCILALACTIAACNTDKAIYSQRHTLDVEGWNYPDSLSFTFDIQDTSRIHSLTLDIEHTTDFPYQNIYMGISTRFPSGKQLHQNLSSDLAQKNGKWYGKCSGKNCKATINLQQKAKFNETGTHQITIAQATRDSSLVGLRAMRLRIE